MASQIGIHNFQVLSIFEFSLHDDLIKTKKKKDVLKDLPVINKDLNRIDYEYKMEKAAQKMAEVGLKMYRVRYFCPVPENLSDRIRLHNSYLLLS